MAENEEHTLQIRSSLKAQTSFNNYPKWKHKLRENCYRRVRQDRSRLLWKLRLANDQPHKDLIKSSLEDIVSDEIQKFKHSYQSESFDNSKFSLALDDTIWEYNGLHEAYQGDCEEMLLEMQRIFYEDLRMEETKVQDSNETWDDEEDEYLARAVYEHMNLNEKGGKEVWCSTKMMSLALFLFYLQTRIFAYQILNCCYSLGIGAGLRTDQSRGFTQ
ncbi:hypothetical protein K7X08_000027 [Anisodus acutangulus]|uniref:RPA-interacting protein N-terminal domain-containing protein n=1 Tax=Anisodus acutangulus TaxID=402998 RepID=A0A9Q1RJ12_9SOLA|nr:hypothetical protein K7X08_000027 [Anisodus acutangulus]